MMAKVWSMGLVVLVAAKAVEGATLLLRLDRLLAITALTEAALFGRIRLREEACSRASGMPSSHLGN